MPSNSEQPIPCGKVVLLCRYPPSLQPQSVLPQGSRHSVPQHGPRLIPKDATSLPGPQAPIYIFVISKISFVKQPAGFNRFTADEHTATGYELNVVRLIVLSAVFFLQPPMIRVKGPMWTPTPSIPNQIRRIGIQDLSGCRSHMRMPLHRLQQSPHAFRRHNRVIVQNPNIISTVAQKFHGAKIVGARETVIGFRTHQLHG